LPKRNVHGSFQCQDEMVEYGGTAGAAPGLVVEPRWDILSHRIHGADIYANMTGVY
jgi:hypothetical protein